MQLLPGCHESSIVEKILCTCILFGCIFYVAFLLETASTKWSASLNAFYICIRKGTFGNMLNQIHVNLLKNKFPHNIIHTQCNINMQWSERLHLTSIDVVHGYIELYHDKDSDLYIPIEDNWNFCKIEGCWRHCAENLFLKTDG